MGNGKGLSEKALGNYLTQYRLAAAERIPELRIRKTAADYLVLHSDYFRAGGMDEQKLKDLELGNRAPDLFDLINLADTYGADLLFHHCHNICAVGRVLYSRLEDKPMEQVAIQMKLETKGVDGTVDSLLQIAADGEIDPGELPILQGILNVLAPLKAKITDVEVLAAKHGIFPEGA